MFLHANRDTSTTNDSHLLPFTPSSMSCFYTQFVLFIFFHVSKLSRLLSFREAETRVDIKCVIYHFDGCSGLDEGRKFSPEVTNDFPRYVTTSARLIHQHSIIIGFVFVVFCDFLLKIVALMNVEFKKIWSWKITDESLMCKFRS